jgi:parallel beta-helix repeat protein
VWEYDTVFLNSDVQIANGTTLTIEKGTKVIATGFYKIDVKGRLLAIGTPQSFIHFGVRDTTRFSDTSTTLGGWNGLHFENIPLSNDSSIIQYCKISYGKTLNITQKEGSGGGIHIDSFSKIKISNNEIIYNIARFYGAGIYISNASPIIEGNLIKSNTAYYAGAGIAVLNNSRTKIEKNIFINNKSLYQLEMPPFLIYSGSGSAIYVSSNINNENKVLINRNLIANNYSFDGSIYESSWGITISNNIIVNNVGYGIYNGHQLGQGNYINNTICYNTEPGVFCISGALSLYNNIIRYNIGRSASTYRNIDYILGGFPSLFHNNIEGRMATLRATNIDSVTLFVRPTTIAGTSQLGYEADWRLQASSPEINAGTTNSISHLLSDKDVYGNPRIIGQQIDIGAAEYSAPTQTIEPSNHENIKVYPNPFAAQLWIDISTLKNNVYYKIFSINGQVMEEGKLNPTINLIETDRLANGNYILILLNQQGEKIYSSKLVKTN